MKKAMAVMMATMMTVSLAACGGSSTATETPAEGNATEQAASGETFELRLATNLPDDHVATQGYYEFAKQVEEETDGAVKVTVYPGEQLGKEPDVTSSIAMNAKTCDIVMAGSSELAKYNDIFTMFDAPYVFDDGDAMVAFANSEEVQALYDEVAAESNLRVLGAFYYGARQLTTNGYAAKTPAELAGCKLRVPDSEMAMKYGAGLGATPTVMSLGEVYMGIQQGVVDGQENPLPTIDSNAFYEVCDNLVMTGHVIAAVSYIVDETTWQTIPADLQAIVSENATESCLAITEAIKSQEEGLVSVMEENGMNVVEVDKAAFQENCAPIYDEYADVWGEWLATAQSFNAK